MGSTQLLLLVLVLILVGVAITLAVGIFNENAASSNLDRLTEYLLELGARAQKYYRTPVWLAGGGRSFMNLTADDQGIALLTRAPINMNGTFTVLVAGTDTKVTLQGVGVEDGDRNGTNCMATIEVFADSMNLTVLDR